MSKLKKMLLPVAALLLTAPSLSLGAPDIKEGSWETATEVTMEMPAGMPAMQPMTFKNAQCITKSDLIPKTGQKDDKCVMKEQKLAGNKATWKVRCEDKDGSVTDGDGEITYKKDSYSGSMTMKMTPKGGQPMKRLIKLSGAYKGPCKK
ncbi:MAG: DUF3617 family protein [Deltaproteobacteria bacterium]|nr:DUF3617 family protein [Deltaproteobacteria bacterium]